MTDEIEGIIRDAKPGKSHRTDPVSESGLRLLKTIHSDEPIHMPEHRLPVSRVRRGLLNRTRKSLVTGTFTAMFVLIAIVISMLQQTIPAQAATPELLRATAISETAADMARELGRVRASGTGTNGTANTIRLSEWSLHSHVNDNGQIESSDTEPQWRELTFNNDGSVRMLLVAGEPFAGQESKNLPEPGTILEETTYDNSNPFDLDNVYVAEPPTDPALVGVYLAATIGVDSASASDYVDAIAGVLSNRIITAKQEAALLQFVGTLPNVQLDGRATDRLGRPGVVLRATDDAQYQHLLVVSPDTGKMLATETIYVGSARTDISSPAVVSYVAWDR